MTDDEPTPPAPRELPSGEDEPATPPSREAPVEPAPRPEDENLFDESATRKVKRRIPVAIAVVPPAARDAAVRATGHEDGQADATLEPEAAVDPTPVIPAAEPPAPRRGWLAVPRVAFDPEAEAARLKAADTKAGKSARR